MKYLEDYSQVDVWMVALAWLVVGVAVVSVIAVDSSKRFRSPMNVVELIIYPVIWFVPLIIYVWALISKGEK